MRESSHLRDSALFGPNWATEEMREWFTESRRTRAWLSILAAVAEAHADIGAIPRAAAVEIAGFCRADDIDLEAVALRNRATGHSTAGLLEAVRQGVPEDSAGFVGLGTTVQDITDTWTALTLAKAADLVDADLRRLVRLLRDGVEDHAGTVMLARTHGQPGVPTTFAFKQAQWGSELDRHLERAAEGRPRWSTAQLGGSVGTMAFWGDRSEDLAKAFAARIGLAVPTLPWGSARDCVAEFGSFAALVGATLARVGNEVFQLQRPEIGEVRERPAEDAISSVTMPQKRNPERSEQLVTLARMIRADAGLLVEGMLVEHERDGRSWKAEWAVLPDLCCSLVRATSLCVELVATLEVDVDVMRQNAVGAPLALSEQAVRHLYPSLGVVEAVAIVRSAAQDVTDGRSESLAEALAADGMEGDDRHLSVPSGLDGAVASAKLLAKSWRRDSLARCARPAAQRQAPT